MIKKNLTKNIGRYCCLTGLMFLSAINYNLFLNPNNIVSGGTNGLSIVIQKLLGFDPATFIFIFSAVVLIFSFIILGVEMSSSSIYAIIIYPLFVSLTEKISSVSYLKVDNPLLVGIFAGIISGYVIGNVCKLGFSQGGVVQISQIINKIFKISIAKANFWVNTIILIGGLFVFGVADILLGIVVLFISSFVANRVLIGISSNKTFVIITNQGQKIKRFISKDLGYDMNTFVIDKIKDINKILIISVIPNRDYYRLVEGIKKIDNDIFFVVIDSYQLEGGF